MKITRIPEANPDTVYPFRIPVKVESNGDGPQKGFVVGSYRNPTQARLTGDPAVMLAGLLVELQYENAEGRREPLEDEEGQPIELTAESLESLGVKFLTSIAEGIAADASPKRK